MLCITVAAHWTSSCITLIAMDGTNNHWDLKKRSKGAGSFLGDRSGVFTGSFLSKFTMWWFNWMQIKVTICLFRDLCFRLEFQSESILKERKGAQNTKYNPVQYFSWRLRYHNEKNKDKIIYFILENFREPGGGINDWEMSLLSEFLLPVWYKLSWAWSVKFPLVESIVPKISKLLKDALGSVCLICRLIF